MYRRLAARWSLALTGALVAGAVHAQEAEPGNPGRTRLGPLGLTPTASITAGLDDNIFNQDEDPKEDYVLYATPQLQSWLRAGRLNVTLNTVAPVAYFRRYSDQSSVGVRSEVQVDVNLRRFRPYVNETFVNSQERTSPEIDIRPRRLEQIVGGGARIDLFSRLTLTLGAEHSTSKYEKDAVFENVNLAEALNRRGETVTVSLAYPLTSLTRLVLTAERLTERFEFQSSRDSNTLRVLPGVELDALALVKGRAFVGYRKFNIVNSETPEFTGLVSSVDVSSSPWGTGQLSASVRRDVSYSFEPLYPYFVLNGVGASIVQVVRTRWRLSAHGDRQMLDYRPLGVVGRSPESARDPDRVYTYGGGIQFQLRPNLGVGVAVDSSRRVSGLARRQYEGTRIYTSVSYGP